MNRQKWQQWSNAFEAQLKLRNAKVAVVGAGGLGCPALQYLAAAGVGGRPLRPGLHFSDSTKGRIGIVDHDTVDLSNLQRQILHKEQSVGQLKAESAAASLKQYLWSTIMLSAHD